MQSCEHKNTAGFPKDVRYYTQYGPTYRSVMVCLNQGHFLPYYRLSQISKSVFVSQGTLVNMVVECHRNLEQAEEHIKQQLASTDILHLDETGTRLNGKNNWLHTAGSEQYTHYAGHSKHGDKATREIGILPEFTGIAVHDF